MKRCSWANPSNPLYLKYHDKEWGVPVHDDRKLFEMLILEGAQAGLSWETILKKRQNYREAFDGFDAQKIARYDDKKIAELLGNAGIIRNRLKIRATIENARAFLEIQKEFGSFDAYLWRYVDGAPIDNRLDPEDPPICESDVSAAISKDLKKRGMRFVGPTIIYAFMQAVGMVNDHTTDCFRHGQLQGAR